MWQFLIQQLFKCKIKINKFFYEKSLKNFSSHSGAIGNILACNIDFLPGSVPIESLAFFTSLIRYTQAQAFVGITAYKSLKNNDNFKTEMKQEAIDSLVIQ